MTDVMLAKAKRKDAARARRLAAALALDADRQRLLDYADELEREAEALERQVDHRGAAGSAVPQPDAGHGQHPQQQQHQQQQQQSEASPGDNQGNKGTPTQ